MGQYGGESVIGEYPTYININNTHYISTHQIKMQEIKLKFKRIMNLIFPKYINNKQFIKTKSRNKFGFPIDLNKFR